jgi:hypothetical protein
MFASSRRGGVRGGTDRFKWDDVAKDKYKEYYLGHSLYTSSKRTFNNPNPNPLWYLKDDKSAEKSELEKIRREEEQMMKWMTMGLDPLKIKAALTQQNQLDKDELEKLTARGQTDKDYYDTAARVTGLGFGDERRPLGSKKISLEPPKEAETRLEGEEDPKLMKNKEIENKNVVMNTSEASNKMEAQSDTEHHNSHDTNSDSKQHKHKKDKKTKHKKHKKSKHKHKDKKDKKKRKRTVDENDSEEFERTAPPTKKLHEETKEEKISDKKREREDKDNENEHQRRGSSHRREEENRSEECAHLHRETKSQTDDRHKVHERERNNSHSRSRSRENKRNRSRGRGNKRNRSRSRSRSR